MVTWVVAPCTVDAGAFLLHLPSSRIRNTKIHRMDRSFQAKKSHEYDFTTVSNTAAYKKNDQAVVGMLDAPKTTATVTNDNPNLVDPGVAAVAVAAVILCGTPAPALAAAGPIPSAAFAWLHFLGIMGVTGGLVTERFLIEKNMSADTEGKLNLADGVYGLSALSLLVSGYFRLTEYGKGWEYYQNEPIFWLKMSAVAVLGGLSFFPTIIFFRRDQARKQGIELAPLSDAIVDRIATILNAELLAIATIPLMASLMARGVLYVQDFPWQIGVVLYALSLGGAGFKYGKEAFQMMEAEHSLVPLQGTDKANE
jgi:putative membrane protein